MFQGCRWTAMYRCADINGGNRGKLAGDEQKGGKAVWVGVIGAGGRPGIGTLSRKAHLHAFASGGSSAQSHSIYSINN